MYFFGFQNSGQISVFYSIADIFVLPAKWESWGLVINEAMCFGLPIITSTTVNAGYDLVRDGENGYLLEPDDLDGLIERMEKLLRDPILRAGMGESSRKIISGWNYDLGVKAYLQALGYIHGKKHRGE